MKTRPDPSEEIQSGSQRDVQQPGPAGTLSVVARVGAFSGAAYVLLANIGSALVGEAGDNQAESPGQLILDEQQRIAQSPWTHVAFAVVVLAQLALIMFVGYVYSRLRNAGWLAATALVGGIAAIMANLLSMSIVIAVFVLRADIPPELARAFADVDGAAHLVQLLPLGVFALFASAAALLTGGLGRVLSWAGMVVGALSIAVLAATGIPANEDFFLWPFLLVVLWMGVISLRWGFTRNHPKARAAVAPEGPATT